MFTERNNLLQPLHLQKIFGAVIDSQDLSLQSGFQHAITLRRVYQSQHPKYNISPEMKERFEKEQAFGTAIGDIKSDINSSELSTLQMRELKTEFILAYWLFVANGIEELYQRYVEKHGPVSYENEQTIKLSIATSFISRRMQNAKELPIGVTHGYETERKNNASLSKAYDALYWRSHAVDLSGSEASIEIQKEEREKALRYYMLLRSAGLSNLDIKEGIEMGVPIVSILAAIGTIEKPEKIEGPDIGEIMSYPSYSHMLQMVEYLYIQRSLLKDYPAGIHRTSTVELSDKHTEVMAFHLIGEAAGFLPNSMTIEQYLEHKKKKGKRSFFGEWTGKISINGRYYPYWRSKDPRKARAYPVNPPRALTEERSLDRFEKGSYIGFVRYAHFRLLGDICIDAAQMPDAKKTMREYELTYALNHLLSEWNRLLQLRANTKMPKNKNRGLFRTILHGSVEGDLYVLERDKGTTAYEHLSDTVNFLSLSSPELKTKFGSGFRGEARSLVTTFNMQVREIEKKYGHGI